MRLGTMRALIVAAALGFAPTLVSAQTVYHRGNTAEPETLDVHKTSTV